MGKATALVKLVRVSDEIFEKIEHKEFERVMGRSWIGL